MSDVLMIASYIQQKEHIASYDTKKLQKLVYFAQAWSLAWTGKPLFTNRFEAWPDGPVVSELYRFQHHDSLPEYDGSLSQDAVDVIDSVLRYYGPLGYQDLVDLTHEHTPWIEARGRLAPTARSKKHLNDKTIQQFYTMRAILDPDGPTRHQRTHVLSDDDAEAIGAAMHTAWRDTLSLLART